MTKSKMNCTQCGKPVAMDTTFCAFCGEELLESGNKGVPVLLILMGIGTIMGSLFGMARGWFYESVADVSDNHSYWRGSAFIILNLGTLSAAILMLNKKKVGLFIYTFFQTAYILMVFYTIFIYSDEGEEVASAAALFIGSIFLVPSVLFLIVYWTDPVRKNFR